MGKTLKKVQSGLLVAFVKKFNAYVINGFVRWLIDLTTQILCIISVIEFDSKDCSWDSFRKEILGITNSSKAVSNSLRGKLYADYPVELPGSDNFVRMQVHLKV